MLYFAKEYGLTYSAAFPGCSEQTEPSASTISYLIDKVKKDIILLSLRLNYPMDRLLVLFLKKQVQKSCTIQSMHNVSAEDFDNGETYVSIMRKNAKAVKEALQ